MPGLDADLILLNGGFYDMQIADNGDIKSADAFDASIIVAIFAEKRASASEIPNPRYQKGWIGNQGKDFEIGSKVWLYEQARQTRTTLNNLDDAIREGLSAFVEEGYAAAIEGVETSFVGIDGLGIKVSIKRLNGEVEERYFEIWNNTGIS